MHANASIVKSTRASTMMRIHTLMNCMHHFALARFQNTLLMMILLDLLVVHAYACSIIKELLKRATCGTCHTVFLSTFNICSLAVETRAVTLLT